MAINPETQYPGKVEPATPANPFGTARNITTPGDGTGTPWESAIQKDNWAFQHAMLLNAGMEPNGTPDVADNSQLFKAAKASIGNGANLLSNHNFLIASPDDSQPPPDATPRSYPPGFQIFSGVFANETTGITDLTYINGRVSFTAGDFYIPRANSKELENVTEFTASVADFDGKPRTRGVSFALVGDEYRVTVGVDALEDAGGNTTPLGSVKFEQGSVATGHEVFLGDIGVIHKASGGRLNFTCSSIINNGKIFNIIFDENSLQGSTLNGKEIKILDVYNTEQSQWSINSGQDASKNLPKNKIYRTVSEGMVSSDVIYEMKYDVQLGFYIIDVKKLYKHTFIKCGNGQEITELQDAFGYISQFDKGMAMDPTFLQSSASTDFYPNKAQISITLPAGTAVSPVTSVFTKFIRIGENDLNGVEIINDTRYSSNQPPEACIAEYSGSLDSDNLAFLTVWKSNLGEVRGITWKFTGEFDGDNQGVVRYQRTESRFKNCIIDVSSATFSSPSLNNVVGFYCDRPMENFGNKFIGPTTDQPISAIDIAGGLTGDWEVSGRPKFVLSHRLDVIAAGINVTGNPENMFFPKGQTSVYLSGSSSNINATNLNFQSIPFDLYIENNVTVVPSQWQRYKNAWTQIGRQFIVESTQNSQIIAQTPDGSAARFGVAPNGSVNAGVGNYASTNSLEFSGDGSTRHWQVTSSGVLQPGADNTYAFGSAGRRPTELFAVTDVINTSDANLKTELREMSESEYNAGIELADNIGVYQWLDMVEKKGDGAREHVGLTVQYAISVMEKHGLDPFKKAFICFDEWEDLTESVMIDGEEIVTFTPSGQRYSFRYTQLTMLMISAISKRQRDILQRLDKAGL